MPFANSNGLRMYYEEVGEGVPLIMLHAFPTDRGQWLFQTHAFSSSYRTIAIDMRGFGKSERKGFGAGKITIRDMSNDLFGLFGALDIQNAHLMGLSMGSLVAMQFSLLHPEKVKRLILAGTYAHLTTRGIHEVFDRWIALLEQKGVGAFLDDYYSLAPTKIGGVETSDYGSDFITSTIGSYLIADMKRRGFYLDPKIVVEIIKGFKEYDLRKQLEEIRAPALVIAGERDLLEDVKEVHKLIAKSRITVIKDSGHFCCLDNPREFNQLSNNFLRDDAD